MMDLQTLLTRFCENDEVEMMPTNNVIFNLMCSVGRKIRNKEALNNKPSLWIVEGHYVNFTVKGPLLQILLKYTPAVGSMFTQYTSVMFNTAFQSISMDTLTFLLWHFKAFAEAFWMGRHSLAYHLPLW